jgi:hypothetical protein
MTLEDKNDRYRQISLEIIFHCAAGILEGELPESRYHAQPRGQKGTTSKG